MGTRYGPGVALLVVDLQNDFATGEGSLYVRGGEEIIDGVNAEIAAAVEAGSPVFYTQDWHPPSTPHFVTDGGVWPPHCVAGTPGADLHPDLKVAGTILRKGMDGSDGYSGFSLRDPETDERSSTVLGELLADAEVTSVVLVGLAGDYCVLETALDARRLGLEVTVPLCLTRFVELRPGDAERAIERMAAAEVRIIPAPAGATALPAGLHGPTGWVAPVAEVVPDVFSPSIVARLRRPGFAFRRGRAGRSAEPVGVPPVTGHSRGRSSVGCRAAGCDGGPGSSSCR